VSNFVMLEDEAALDRAWEGVGEGGTVLMPLDAYDWSSRYGWLEDQFGFSWQLALGSRTEIGGQALAPALLFTGERAGQAEGVTIKEEEPVAAAAPERRQIAEQD
jgi:predicted 3-demethylubiquinone-9 3-methyltransferase (glyoxalase superfamily)